MPDGRGNAGAGSPWCEACRSWHPTPTSREHWAALHCFAPCPFPQTGSPPTPEERARDVVLASLHNGGGWSHPGEVERRVAAAIRAAVAAETDRCAKVAADVARAVEARAAALPAGVGARRHMVVVGLAEEIAAAIRAGVTT